MNSLSYVIEADSVGLLGFNNTGFCCSKVTGDGSI